MLGPPDRIHTAESRAHAVRQNLVTVLDASDDAITTCSLDGIFVTWNRGAEKVYGYTAEEAIGQPLDLIVPPEEREHEHSRWERLLTDETVKSLETRRTTKDGRSVVVAVTRSLILDGEGTVVGVASVGRDITDDPIFMDCQMPEVDGFEATRALRAKGDLTPIVALTAYASDEDRQRCLDAGMNDYLTKPLRKRDLDALLERYLPA